MEDIKERHLVSLLRTDLGRHRTGSRFGIRFRGGSFPLRTMYVKTSRIPDLDGLETQVCHRTGSESLVKFRGESVPPFEVYT